MRPVPRLTICLAIPWVSSSGPVTLTSNWWRMFDAGMSTVEPPSPHAGVVDQDLDVPVQGLAAVAVVGDVELLDLQGHAALGCLALERLDLPVDLHGGDDVKALLGQTHRDFVTEPGTGSGDQNLLF